MEDLIGKAWGYINKLTTLASEEQRVEVDEAATDTFTVVYACTNCKSLLEIRHHCPICKVSPVYLQLT